MAFVVLALLLSVTLGSYVEQTVRFTAVSPEQHQILLDMGVLLDRDGRGGRATPELIAGPLRTSGIAFQVVAGDDVPRDLSQYHHQEALAAFVDERVRAHPTLVEKHVLGQSVLGRDLIAVRLGSRDTAYRPKFKWVANMHGDETVGRELLIRLIDDLLVNGTDLLTDLEIWVLPTMNPDGFEAGTRANARGLDLNRNFPDRFGWTIGPPQPETTAVMAWTRQQNFTLSANLHGGDLVANYPWDGNVQRRSGLYAGTPDDLTFRFLASTYASAHPGMRASRQFRGGITNGAQWYVLYGGMQDWNYYVASGMEITLELSVQKYPSASALQRYWDENRAAMYAYMRLLQRTGVCIHAPSYPGAEVRFSRALPNGVWGQIDHITRLDDRGRTHRMLAPGDYRMEMPAHPNQVTLLHVPIGQTQPLFLEMG